MERGDAANSKLWHLKQCPLFSALSPEETTAVYNYSQIISLAPMRVVKPPPSPEPSVWIVKRGHVKLNYTDAEGRTATVIYLNPGDLFGALGASGADAFGEFAQTVTGTCLCQISRARLDQLIRKYPDLGFRVMSASFEQLQRLHFRMAEFMTRPAEGRLAYALLDLEKSFGVEDSEPGRLIDIAVAHRDLAELIGTSREMVSHVMRRFKSAGLVDTRRQRICVLDREGLERLAKN